MFFNFHLLLLLFCFPRETTSLGAGKWSYFDEGGTKIWEALFPKCKGNRQSPIDIITPLAIGQDFGRFKIENYNEASTHVLLKNDGLALMAELQLSPKAKISGGGLKQDYTGHSFYFHWGSTDDYGSEHFKDGTAFPMELHIVHYASKYKDIIEAQVQPKGVAILAFFFFISTRNNSALQGLIEKFPKIQAAGVQVNVNAKLGTLIPKDLDKYYRYFGSLTNPPCHETVVWTIFESPIPVSPLQMTDFRSRLEMKAGSGPKMIQDNYRHIQPLKQRKIYKNKAGRPIQHKALVVILMIGVHFL